IDDSCKKIADIIGRTVDKIAIPFGSYDRRVLSRLRRSAFQAVYTSDGGRAPFSGWLLPRETFRKSTWSDRKLVAMASRRFPIKVLQRAVVGFIKRSR